VLDGGEWATAVFVAFGVSSAATLVALVVAVVDARRRSARVGPGAPHPAPSPTR
jgi:heme exporter protein D